MIKSMCKHCQYCKQYGRSEAQGIHFYGRKHYYCEHPQVNEASKDKWGYSNNFIGFGDMTYKSPLQLKTAKKWCPLNNPIIAEEVKDV